MVSSAKVDAGPNPVGVFSGVQTDKQNNHCLK